MGIAGLGRQSTNVLNTEMYSVGRIHLGVSRIRLPGSNLLFLENLYLTQVCLTQFIHLSGNL